MPLPSEQTAGPAIEAKAFKQENFLGGARFHGLVSPG
jgi:hypothetical protein